MEDSQNRNHTGVGKPLDHGGLLLQLKLSRCATIISVTGAFDTAPHFCGYDQTNCQKTAPPQQVFQEADIQKMAPLIDAHQVSSLSSEH